MKNLRVYKFYKIAFNNCGFYGEGHESSPITWDSIIRVAVVFEIDDAALECSYYWAFQNQDPENTFWVSIKNSDDDFSAEIKKRYGDPQTPHETKWRGVNGKVFSYVIWPLPELGKGIYVEMKKKFWQLGIKMSYSTF